MSHTTLGKDLNHQAIDSNQITGWQMPIWIFWGNRPYARNLSSDSAAIPTYIFSFMLATVGWIAFYFIPFKLFGVMLAAGITLPVLLWPIAHANQSRWVMWLPIIIGALGLYTHWQWHFSLFGYSFAKQFFMLFLASGTMALYRRFLNGFILRVLD